MNQYKMSAYQKTEDVLKNYNKIKKSIALLEEEFKRLEIEKKKIAQSIVKSNKVVLKDVDNNYYYTDETLENRINELKQLVIKIKAEIKFIDDCIFHLKDDYYYEIIPLFYFKNKTAEWLAERYNTSSQTIYSNKARLIHELSYLIVPLDKIDEIKKIT